MTGRISGLAAAAFLALSCGGSGGDGDGGAGGAAGQMMGTGGTTTGGTGGVGTGGMGTGGSSGTGGGAGSGTGGGGGAAGGGTGGGSGGSGGGGAGGAPSLDCPPLAAATGNVIPVDPSQAAMLDQIVSNAQTGDTIELADGTYDVPRMNFRTPGVTLRSASNDASRVVLTANYSIGEPIFITASDVTIAHVTIQEASFHPIHVTPPNGGPFVTGTRIYGAVIRDGRQQFVKINSNGNRDAFVDDGVIECTDFVMTTNGRANVDRATAGCYTGGIDAHAARGWVVRNNRFRDIYCDGSGLAEHAIHFWRGSRDTLVENNIIINCARGIGFGLSGSPASERSYSDNPYGGADLAHIDGIIRNNVVYADIDFYDTGIELQRSREPLVIHNTVISTQGAGFFSSIDARFDETVVELVNNLTRRITTRSGATINQTTNLEMTPLDYFLDAAGGDFHLASGAANAIDQGTAHPEAGVDIDGNSHDQGGGPDLGADER